MREKIAIDYAMKHVDKGEVFHSSGYAQAQSGGNMGTAAGADASFAARQALEQQRKYIQGYRNSRIMNSFYGVQRAKNYTPPSQRGERADGTKSRYDTEAKNRYNTEAENRYSTEVAGRNRGLGGEATSSRRGLGATLKQGLRVSKATRG